MRYSKKRRYRKKQRGGNETKTEFSYPESDMAYAQIYGLIQNEALRKSVIEEMTKGDEILFTSRDLTPKISPGIMDIKLYKIVVETAEKEVYNVNPDLGPGVNTATGSYTSETFKNTILNKQYGREQISEYYDNDDNLFLRHLIDAFYNSAEKTLAPSLQEKSFLKELFTSGDNQHTYIDSIFSSNGGTNNKIELIVLNDLVYSIVFKNLAGITGAKLADLDKLKGLKKITIQDDITKYSAIKSNTLEEVIIETDTLTKSDQLLFLGGCPMLKMITIKSKDLKGNIDAVLKMLPSGEAKTMVDLKGSYALESGDINDLVKVIKDKKITGIAFPNQMSQFISTNNVALSEALKPIFLKSVFGQSVSVTTEKINDTLIEQYSELVKLFPKEFKIEEKPEGSDMKYTISEGTVMGGQPVCELTTTMGDDTKNSRKLKTINFKKGMTKVILNKFDYLTQVSIDYDVELTEIKITDCKNKDFHLEFVPKDKAYIGVGIVITKQPTLTSIIITGLAPVAAVSVAPVGMAAPAPAPTVAAMSMKKLYTLTSVDIDWLKMDFLSLIDCKSLKTVSLPRSLTQLIITNAPIENTDFLKPLTGIVRIFLSGCSKFNALTLPEEPDGTPKKDTIVELNLDRCASLTNLNLDGYSKLQTLSVNPPDAASSVATSSVAASSNEMSLIKVEIISCDALDTLSVPPSVENLVINTASELSNTTFLSGLNLLEQLIIRQCPKIETIVCKPFAQKIKTLIIDNCLKLTSISDLDDVQNLKSFITIAVPNLKQLSLDNCTNLNDVYIKNVERLVLKGCALLKSDNITLPDLLLSLEISGTGFDKLEFLEKLKLTLDSLKLDLNNGEIGVDGFKSLSAIEIKGDSTTSVTISGCEKLSYIGKMPLVLKTLSVKGSSITSTRFLKDLNVLESLTITQTQKYAVSDSLPASLKTLEFENSAIETDIFDRATNLETIKITNDAVLTNRGLLKCNNLITLELKQCTSLTITKVSNLTKLTSIYIDAGAFTEFSIVDCNALNSINLPKTLTNLIIESNITGFDFTGLTALEAFTMKGNNAVTEVAVAVPAVPAVPLMDPAVVDPNVPPGPNITKTDAGKIIIPPSVQFLILDKNDKMTTITNMDGLKTTLETLTIDNCETLITELTFDGFDNLFHLNIDNCKNVKIIDIRNCKMCSSVMGLTNMTALEHLALDGIAENAEVSFNITKINIISIKCTEIKVTNKAGSNLTINNTFSMEGCIFTNPNITLSGTMEKATFNNCKSINASDTDIPINLTIEDSANLAVLEITKSDMGKIHVSNCAALKMFPQITGVPNLTELVLKDLQITELIVSECPALTTVSHDNCNAITNMTFTKVGLKMIDIFKKPALTTVSIDGCTTITDLTVSENPLLTTLTMTYLIALKNLTVNTNGNNLKTLDFAGVPNVEKLDIHSNKGLTNLQNINALKTCSTYYLNNNAINTTLDTIIDSLDGTTDKTVVLDDNKDIKMAKVDDVIKLLGEKRVVGLYAAIKTDIDPNQPTIYNYYRGFNLSQTSRVNTNFINTVGGAVYSGKQMSDIFFLQTILAIPDTDAEIKNINTLINDVSKKDKKYDYTGSSATFTLDPTDGFRITKLVLDEIQISFTNVRQLEQLKSLTIQNNTTVNNEFNNSNPKVLPDGLEELVILDCPNFQLVNLDNIKGTLKLFKNDNQNNMFRFEKFPNLTTVHLGPLNQNSIHFINCPALADVSLDVSTRTIEIVNSPIFQVGSLKTLTRIEKLTLDNQPMDLTSIQSKIEELILKNMPDSFTELKDGFDVLKILEIDNCVHLTSIHIGAPQLESMKMTGAYILNKLTVQGKKSETGFSSFVDLENLKTLDIEKVNILKLDIENCPKLNPRNGVLKLPITLNFLSIDGNGNFGEEISNLKQLITFDMNNNSEATYIKFTSSNITSCTISDSGINAINTEICKNSLEKMSVTNCVALTRVGNEDPETISFTDYDALTTLSVQNSLCTAVVLSNCPKLKKLDLNNNPITDYIVDRLDAITELTIPDTVTLVKAENIKAITTITYTGTAMKSFDVDNCNLLDNIPNFINNNTKMTLLKVSNCPKIDVELVAYLGDLGSVKLVKGGSKNKSRKVSGGMNNKSRRNKRVYRGGAVESINEVDFSNTGATIKDVRNFINLIANKRIKRMFVPDLVKTQIEKEHKSNDFIRVLKLQNNANPPINNNQITNVQVLAEESYIKRRDVIIIGLQNVFKQFAQQEAARIEAARVEAERKAEEEEEKRLVKEKEEADRVAAEKADKEKAKADRVAAEKAAKEKAKADEKERLAKIEVERIEAERVEVERLAKIESERRIEVTRVKNEEIEKQRILAKIEAERIENENKKAMELLLKESNLRIEAEKEAKKKEENAAKEKEETDRLANEKVEQERLAKIEADRLEEERLAKIEADRVAAEQAERERLAKIEADSKVEDIIYSGNLWICEAKSLLGNQRSCDSKKNTTGFVSKITKTGNTICLTIETKNYYNIIYVGNDEGASFNKDQHFFIQLDKATRIFLKSVKGERDIWISEIQKAFNLKPLYICNSSSECKKTNLGRITENSIEIYEYEKENKENVDTYNNITSVSIPSKNEKNKITIEIKYSKETKNGTNTVTRQILETNTIENREWWIKEIQRHFKLVPIKTEIDKNKLPFYTGRIENKILLIRKEDNRDTPFNNIYNVEPSTTDDNHFTILYGEEPYKNTNDMKSDSKENRDWWVDYIQKEIINIKGGKKRGDGKRSDGDSVGNYVAFKKNDCDSVGNVVALSEATDKQNDGNHNYNQNKSNKKRGGKGFRATRKKIRRKSKEPVTKSATH